MKTINILPHGSDNERTPVAQQLSQDIEKGYEKLISLVSFSHASLIQLGPNSSQSHQIKIVIKKPTQGRLFINQLLSPI